MTSILHKITALLLRSAEWLRSSIQRVPARESDALLPRPEGAHCMRGGSFSCPQFWLENIQGF